MQERTIYYNGVIITMDGATEGCSAVLAADGKIAAVGAVEELKGKEPGAALFDLEGRTMLPGFIDGHSHITAVGSNFLLANLNAPPTGSCGSVSDVVRELKKFMKKQEEMGLLTRDRWILGMGYDNSAFGDGGHPTRFDLDKVSEEVPVVAVHVSGHLCAVNTRAMELLGYTGEGFFVPEGGSVEPSGLLKETAFTDPGKQRLMNGMTWKERVASMGEASGYYASFGITTAQDGRTTKGDYEILAEAARKGLLQLDVAMYLTMDAAEEFLPKQNPQKNCYADHLRPAGCKLFLDGSPQGKTAWLSQPYYAAPEGEGAGYCGRGLMSDEELTALMKSCIENHWQINVHANGDAAIEQMIRCHGAASGMEVSGAAASGTEVSGTAASELEVSGPAISGSAENLRPVVIHCQTARRDQIRRMAEIGMLASFFDDHVYYWGDYHYESVLGPERAENISPLSWALHDGVPFTLHQDSPVVPPNIMFAVHNAVNRLTMKGRVLGADHRLSVYEALKAVTVNGAFQIFEEDKKGSITPGKAADFVILDRNPLETPAEELKDIRVLGTIKGNSTIFSA